MIFGLRRLLPLGVACALCSAAPDSSAIAVPSAHDSLGGKYLDMHCHVAGIGAHGSGCFVSPDIRSSVKFSLYLKAFSVSEKEVADSGDDLIADRLARQLDSSKTVGAAVVLALDGVIDSAGRLDTGRTQIYVPDSFVLRSVRRHPRLRYGASINPKRRDAIRRLIEAKKNGALLVKWIPSIMLFDPGDSAFIPFYLAMKRLDLPLLSHTGKESSFKTARNEMCDPQRLRLPLSLGVTVIAAHVATRGRSEGQDNMERIFTMFPQYPNLYADVSSLTQINKLGLLAKVLRRPEAHHRLLYGTDYPLIQTALVSPYYFPLQLSVVKMHALSGLKNPWDQDVGLKKALGVPEEVFGLSAKLLLKPAPKLVEKPKPAPPKPRGRKAAAHQLVG